MSAKNVRLIQGKKGNNNSWSVYAPIPQPNTIPDDLVKLFEDHF